METESEHSYSGSDDSLTDILESLIGNTGNGDVSVRDITNALESRGFGPLLVAPALLVILPTGAIPGVPAIGGICIILIAGQLLLGRDRPWLPARIGRLSIQRSKLESAVNKVRPVTRKIDNYVESRFAELAESSVSESIIAVTCIGLAALMISIGFIPMAPALLALPVLLFGLGLSMQDGLLLFLGYCAIAVGAALML